MKCNLYLETYNDDIDSKFDIGNYYKDSDAYIKALNSYAMQETDFMKIDTNNSNKKYTKCSCLLYDDNNEPMTIDKFVGYYNSDSMTMLVIELVMDSLEDEFDSEFNGWFNEHKSLEKIKKITDEERFTLEPKMDVKLTFLNLANKETYCTLSNVSFIDKIDSNKYAILVDKIIFTKTF